MNDKGKGKAVVAASSSSSAASDPFSDIFAPATALSKTLEALSKGKGKSKEQGEPLPGGFLAVSPQCSPDWFPSRQSIPHPTSTRCATSVLSRSRPHTLPSLLP